MITVHAVGDLVLERDDARSLLAPAADTLRGADLVIGQLEIPHVEAGVVQTTDVPAVPGPPAALDALAEAGFGILTLAGNHVYDFGVEGMRETARHCHERGMRTAGTGETIDEAFEPAIAEIAGTRVAVLSVNCVGPRESWATTLKPGAAYIEVVTHELEFARNAADRCVFMADGHIIEDRPSAQFFDHPESTRLRAFLTRTSGAAAGEAA